MNDIAKLSIVVETGRAVVEPHERMTAIRPSDALIMSEMDGCLAPKWWYLLAMKFSRSSSVNRKTRVSKSVRTLIHIQTPR